MPSVFARFIDPFMKDQIRLAREEIVGYVRGNRLSYGVH